MLFINSKLLKQYGRKIATGQILFEEGQEGKTMYVIYTGKIEISKKINNQNKILSVLGDSDFFGEMALLNSERRSATAKAIANTELLEIDQLGFEALLKKSPEIALRLVAGLSARLRDMNQRLEILLPTDPLQRIIKNILFSSRKASAIAGKNLETYKGPHRFRLDVQEFSNSINLDSQSVQKYLDVFLKSEVLKVERDFTILENEENLNFLSKYISINRNNLNLN